MEQLKAKYEKADKERNDFRQVAEKLQAKVHTHTCAGGRILDQDSRNSGWNSTSFSNSFVNSVVCISKEIPLVLSTWYACSRQ